MPVARVEGVHRRPDGFDQGDELVGGRLEAVDPEPLLEPVEVRRAEQAGLHARGRQRGGDHRRGRPLALGPGDVDDLERLVGVAQPSEEPAHPAEAKLGRPLGHAEPLVVEPAVEVVEAVLVVVGHGVGSAGRTSAGRSARDHGGTRPRLEVGRDRLASARSLADPRPEVGQGSPLTRYRPPPSRSIPAGCRRRPGWRASGPSGPLEAGSCRKASRTSNPLHPGIQTSRIKSAGPMLADQLERLEAPGRLPDGVAGRAEAGGIDGPQILVVVGQNDRGHHDCTRPGSIEGVRT